MRTALALFVVLVAIQFVPYGRDQCLVQRDEGRRALDLSTAEVEEMIERIREGSMPPWQFGRLWNEVTLSL